jgi:hypothetical protein
MVLEDLHKSLQEGSATPGSAYHSLYHPWGTLVSASKFSQHTLMMELLRMIRIINIGGWEGVCTSICCHKALLLSW